MEVKAKNTVISAPGKAHIESLKHVMHSVKTLPKGLYGITSEEFGQTHAESARIFLECGAEIVQYRGKRRDDTPKSPIDLKAEAQEIRKMCHHHGALFIVDDRVDIAIAVEADGVHLGQQDMPLEEARQRFKGIIGVSAKTAEQAIAAEKGGADYLGCGAVFPTKTKYNAVEIGLNGLSGIVGKVSIPIYAIGGIKLDNLGAVKKVGPHGIAVISGILAQPDPILAGKTIVRRWNQPDIMR